MTSVATAADKRALNQHVADPSADAAATLAAALAEPPTDPKQLAWMLVWAGKVARDVSGADDLAATTYVRGELTEIQRAVLGATTKLGPGFGGSVEWHQHRLPERQLGRDVLLGRAETPLAAIVDTARGPTPMYVALVDLLAEATLEKWKPARHRAALAALTATADRHALDAPARACPELSAPHALMGLMGATARAWP